MTGEEYAFDKIEKNNPYRLESPEEGIVLSEDLVRYAFRLQRKAFVVKFLAIIDFLTNLIYGIGGNYFTYLIFAACSFAGYLSTITYNKKLLFFYLLYQYLQIIFKISTLLLLIVLVSSSELRDEIMNNNNYTIGFGNPNNLNYSLFIPISILLVVMQGLITLFIYDFYRYLPTRKEVMELVL